MAARDLAGAFVHRQGAESVVGALLVQELEHPSLGREVRLGPQVWWEADELTLAWWRDRLRRWGDDDLVEPESGKQRRQIWDDGCADRRGANDHDRAVEEASEIAGH